MSTKKTVVVALLVSLVMTGGCLMVPGPGGGVSFVPLLPPLVLLDAGPYYVHEGYHYYYHDDGWAYSRSRNGPWVDLPRDHYPKEVRYRDGGPGRDGGPDRGRQEPNPGYQGR